MSVTRRLVRILVALVLTLLGLGHLLFGLANFRFVEELPGSLDVLLEGIAAATAAGTLFWAAVNHVRGRRWGVLVLLGGLAFAAGMVLSVTTGASTPGMLQVVVPILSVAVVALLGERWSRGSGE